VLFIVLKGGDEGGNDGGEVAKATQVLTVDNGEPAGGVKTLTYDKGDQVSIEVRLNTPEEEIHVHGYEIEKPAEKSPVRLSFPAKLDGVFEIEVHRLDGSEGEIAELHVNP
jgi:FtsP/CotA-like multicopper oxidase with cupredoxin domain